MKVAAVLMLVVCIVALGGIGWLYLSAGIDVASVEVIATDALSQADYYALLKEQTEKESFIGTRFSAEPLTAPENDMFYTYTVRMTNHSFLPAEIIELQVTPVSGDLLQIGDPEQHSLPPNRSLDLSATILTGKQGHNVRELTVTWYVWGLPFSVRLMSR